MEVTIFTASLAMDRIYRFYLGFVISWSPNKDSSLSDKAAPFRFKSNLTFVGVEHVRRSHAQESDSFDSIFCVG